MDLYFQDALGELFDQALRKADPVEVTSLLTQMAQPPEPRNHKEGLVSRGAEKTIFGTPHPREQVVRNRQTLPRANGQLYQEPLLLNPKKEAEEAKQITRRQGVGGDN